MDKLERRKVDRVVSESILKEELTEHNRGRFIEAALFLALDALEGIMDKSGGKYNCSAAIKGLRAIRHTPELLLEMHKKGFSEGVEMMAGIEKFSRTVKGEEAHV